jgi:ATP phosphoribosyltransferase regulatory subunit
LILIANRFRYPTGARPLLVEETARRRRIESRIVERLEADGFAEVVLPIIDYAEAYAAAGNALGTRESYRFVDREGELVSIRSDFTPMVARALAPSLRDEELPLRVFYRGDVIRCEASRLGANREMFQIGAELLGDAGVEADASMLSLAAAILRSFGNRPLVIYSDTSIVASLVNAFGEDVRPLLATKRGTSPSPLVDALLAGTATLDDLAAFVPTRAAAERLRAIRELLGDDETFVLHLDDADEAAGYYTGIRFRLYDAATRARIAQGGRYDDLYGRFGASSAAVGFTFTIDDLD